MTWTLIADMPSTQFRILVSVILVALYVIVLLTCVALGRPLQVEIVTALGFFLTVWLGIDVAQFKIKRDSFVAALPMAPEADGKPPTTPVVPLAATVVRGREMGET